jgi:hypothetical protein
VRDVDSRGRVACFELDNTLFSHTCDIHSPEDMIMWVSSAAEHPGLTARLHSLVGNSRVQPCGLQWLIASLRPGIRQLLQSPSPRPSSPLARHRLSHPGPVHSGQTSLPGLVVNELFPLAWKQQRSNMPYADGLAILHRPLRVATMRRAGPSLTSRNPR